MTINSSRRIAGKSREVITGTVEDPNFDRKLDLITEGCSPFFKGASANQDFKRELHNQKITEQE